MESERAEYVARLPRKRMGAGALFVDALGRVLLVEPTYKDYWELPGGVVEAGESPGAAVVREVREELGLRVPLGRLLTVDWVSPGRYADDGLMLIFDGGELETAQVAAIVLQSEELRSWAFCDETEAATRLPDGMARRVAAAVQARVEGRTVYLEDGLAVR
ncbi:NUDIX domain-containing protein [Nocardia sp. CDC160]|uniref:NUDIX domain-containing protein n=1 Tax=Nocardia sp. CDC160 TaxID=3112166 RepID=UPI002DBA75CE|nr:NUDIX domain-containing protein [Nocardia sp. CDC160]MEC3919949.1 NUDIX domain-containing protein [Nocardia sp. CDC160]